MKNRLRKRKLTPRFKSNEAYSKFEEAINDHLEAENRFN